MDYPPFGPAPLPDVVLPVPVPPVPVPVFEVPIPFDVSPVVGAFGSEGVPTPDVPGWFTLEGSLGLWDAAVPGWLTPDVPVAPDPVSMTEVESPVLPGCCKSPLRVQPATAKSAAIPALAVRVRAKVRFCVIFI